MGNVGEHFCKNVGCRAGLALFACAVQSIAAQLKNRLYVNYFVVVVGDSSIKQ